MACLYKNHQKGSVMIEALAMLGLIAMVTPMLYRKAAERTTELQDINVASQIRMVSAAVDSYLKDNYTQLASRGNTFLITNTSGASATELADYSGVSAYLPEGFDLDRASKLFEGFEIAVKKDSATDLEGNIRNVFTSAVVANLKDNMTKVRAARIASMIGTNGGIFDGTNLNGTQGTWTTAPNSFGFNAAPGWRENSIASISNEAISSSLGGVDTNEALFRVNKGDISKNTMQTSLYFTGSSALEMSGHDIKDVNNLIVSGNTSLGGNVISDINLAGNLAFQGSDRQISNVKTITLEASGIINGNGGTIQNFTNISGNNIYGGTINTGAGGLAMGGNITMSGHNITGINIASGETAIFKNITGQTITASAITTSSITIINQSGLTMEGNPINMGGGDITNVGNITMNGSGSTLNMNGGDITNAYNINTVNLNATKVTAQSGIFNYLTASAITSTAITASAITATSITAQSGDFKNLHAQTYLTVGGTTHNQGTVMEVSTDNNGTALFKTNRFGVGSGGTSAYNAAGNKIVVDTGATFVGYNYNTSNATAKGLAVNNSGATMVYNDFGVGLTSSGLTFGQANGVNLVTQCGYTLNATNSAALSGQTNNTIAISRNGAVELLTQSGAGDTTGFIRARRLVSDVKYTPTTFGGTGDAYANNYGASREDVYYQVNPAYTSIMNDIKLASRGGARLSDILPDYINKGIYVADNTYRDSGLFWETCTSSGGSEVCTGTNPAGSDFPSDENSSGTYEASPWLGYVPAPLCPPEYEKVITVEPIRWRMAEAYAFGDNEYSSDSGVWDLGGSSFGTVYYRPTNPRSAAKITVTEDSDGTHDVSYTGAQPLVFQTNTWLNTTIRRYDDSSGDTKGWHTIMGFIYYKNEYEDIVQRMTNGSGFGSDDMAWNVFPVYNQELAAVARVYCSFRRYKDGAWTWGASSYSTVFQYDQLEHPKDNKDTDWIDQVNDPDQSYQPIW